MDLDSNSKKTDVFLSHNWGRNGENHQKVAKINEALQELGYVTWFDDKEMYGDIRARMADGIKNTKCCLAFLTEEYHQKVVYGRESDNCKSEFDFASTTVPVRAVVLEESMTNPHTWEGNIAITLKIKFYVDMSGNIDGREYFAEKMQQLKKELDKIILTTQATTPTEVDQNFVDVEIEELKNLVFQLLEDEKYEEAIPHLQLLVTKQTSFLGHSHPDTLFALQKLAYCYKEEEEYEKAIPTYEDLMKKQTETFGKEHVDTMSSKYELATCLFFNKQESKAIPICEELIEMRKILSGELHEGTFLVKVRHAICFIDSNIEKATSMLQELVTKQKLVLGLMHKNT
eukprot:TCONS_00017687-protein